MANVIVNRSNRLGIPLMLAVSNSSDGTNTTFSFNNHVNLGDNFLGLFLVKLPSLVTTSNQPVLFDTIGVSGSSVPVYLKSGAQALVSNLASTTAPTYHLCIYDRVSNRLQLIE